MLWDAGQDRQTRERRARLAEHYEAARDAAMYVWSTTFRKQPASGARAEPRYLRDGTRPEITRTPGERDRALAALALAYPGVVQGLS